jgi:hypothetical protein
MACLPRASEGADGVWRDGNQLLDACTDQTDQGNILFCYGYIQVIIDMSWYMTGHATTRRRTLSIALNSPATLWRVPHRAAFAGYRRGRGLRFGRRYPSVTPMAGTNEMTVYYL